MSYNIKDKVSPNSPTPGGQLSSNSGFLILGIIDISMIILLRGVTLCIVGYFAASLASMHFIPVATPPPVVMIKNVFKHCQVTPRGQKSPWMEAYCSNRKASQCLQGKWYSKPHQSGTQPASHPSFQKKVPS